MKKKNLFRPKFFFFYGRFVGRDAKREGNCKWEGILVAIAQRPLMGCCVPLKVCCPIELLPLQQAAT
jgi:hypothetical protein